MSTLHAVSLLATKLPRRERLFTAHITHRDLKAYDNSGRLMRHYSSIITARMAIINWLLRDGRVGSRIEVFHAITGEQRAIARLNAAGKLTLELLGDLE